MIDTITLGAIAAALTFIVAVWTSVSFIGNKIKNSIGEIVQKELQPLSKKIDSIESSIKSVDKEQTKNFLVSRFDEIAHGVEIDETMRQRIYEQMEHYTEDLKGNSYVHARFEELKREGKL